MQWAWVAPEVVSAEAVSPRTARKLVQPGGRLVTRLGGEPLSGAAGAALGGGLDWSQLGLCTRRQQAWQPEPREGRGGLTAEPGGPGEA